jgi:hypothetical protein
MNDYAQYASDVARGCGEGQVVQVKRCDARRVGKGGKSGKWGWVDRVVVISD